MDFGSTGKGTAGLGKRNLCLPRCSALEVKEPGISELRGKPWYSEPRLGK